MNAYGPSALVRLNSEEKEQKQQAAIVATEIEVEDFAYKVKRGNSFRTLQHIIAYSLRFINHKDNKLIVIVKEMEKSDFKEELRQHGEVAKLNVLSYLVPFVDAKGIIRLENRLSTSNLSYDAKQQMVLPLLPYNDP